MARFELTPTGNGNGDGGHGAPLPPPHGWHPTYDQPELDEAVDLRDVLGVLRRNAALVIGVAVLVFAGSASLVLTQEPEYRARAVLRLQDERGAMTGGIGNPAVEEVMGKANDPLLSELEVLRSRSVALEVIQETPLRLVPVEGELSAGLLRQVAIEANAPADTLEVRFGSGTYEVRGALGEATAPYGAPVTLAGLSFVVPRQPAVESVRLALLEREAGIDRFAANLSARPREKTDVVDVEFTATDPHLAQQVVNATVETFSELNASTAQESSKRRRVFLEEQLEQTDSVLALAQVALSDFRKRESVFSSRSKFEAQQSGLMGIEVRREEMDADRRMYQSLLDGLTRRGRGGVETLVSSPGIASNPVVAQLYTQLIQYQTSRDSMRASGAAQTNPDLRRIEGLIASTETKLISATRSHVQALDARIAALDGLRGRSEAEMQALPDAEAEEMRLVQRVETVRKMADQLREEYQKARIAEAVEVGQVEVVDMAALPNEPIGSGRSLKLALGLVLGLMLGSGGAFVKEHLNTRIRRREDVEEALQVHGLAVIPQLSAGGAGRNRLRLPIRIAHRNGNGAVAHARPTVDELVTVSDLRSAGAEAFRTLRTNLMFSQASNAIRTLVVTSATPGEGKTTTAANLAVTFAQQGLRVLLIDCDLRRARLHRVFQVPQEPGLTELVLGYKVAGEAIRATTVDGLSLLTSGTLPPNPAELLGGARMKKALELLGQGFDMIVLDTPPLMAATDASILGVRADGVLMVVRAGQTERGAAQQAIQQLAGVGARVVGAVLNDPDAEVQRYGNYYYNYAYYGDDAKV